VQRHFQDIFLSSEQEGRRLVFPINKKEETPTSSQKIYICMILEDKTNANMEKVKRPRKA
jgi:hypothetical protein